MYKKILLSTLLLAVSLLLPSTAKASCDSVVLDPTSGDVNTVFGVRAIGCNLDYRFYTVQIIRSDGSSDTLGFTEINGTYTRTIGKLPEGVYTISIRENGVPIQDFSGVTVGTSSNSGNNGANVPSPAQDCGIPTAIGCIPIGSLNELSRFALQWSIGIAGGIGLIFIVMAAYRITTSTGDPRRLQGGNELLTSAIAGIVMVVLSVFLLRVLGVNVLGLFPG